MSRFAALAFLCLFALIAPASAQNADPQNTLILETTKGRVVIRLRPDLAPKHAERLKLLAREGFYNNVPFHRVIDGFMAQTGDGTRGDGTGARLVVVTHVAPEAALAATVTELAGLEIVNGVESVLRVEELGRKGVAG